MVEIGPGTGILTERIAPAVKPLHVVEVDRDLAAALRTRFAPEDVVVHQADVLEFDFASLPRDLRVVGNLPYNVSTPILFRIAEVATRVRDCVFLLQKEVVERMVARPATAQYGRLSVMLQYRFAMSLRLQVPPGAFTPPPKVDSAVVHMKPLGEERLRAADESFFARIVAAGFEQRRKTLRNALRAGAARRYPSPNSCASPTPRPDRASRLLDELDLVAVGILDERDHAAAELHRPGLARDLAALRAHRIARLVRIGDGDREVAEAVPEVIRLRLPVVRELDHGGLGLVPVTDEGERELAIGIVLAPKALHPEDLGVENDRAIEVADADHRVQESHGQNAR